MKISSIPINPVPKWAPPYIDNFKNKKTFLKECTNSYVYLWLNNGTSFWFYCSSVENDYIFGYVQTKINIWKYAKININSINSFA